MFSLTVHPGAEPWTPSPTDLAKLQSAFANVEGQVHIWPRSVVDRITGRVMGPYAFRGFTRGPVSHLFVDYTETPRSITWLMAHELCHHTVHNNPTLHAAFNRAKPDLAPASDRFHEIDPHELYCDGIASNILGYRLDRHWWRTRTPKAQDKSAASAMLAHRYGPD